MDAFFLSVACRGEAGQTWINRLTFKKIQPVDLQGEEF
jgi:hypothetical protein